MTLISWSMCDKPRFCPPVVSYCWTAPASKHKLRHAMTRRISPPCPCIIGPQHRLRPRLLPTPAMANINVFLSIINITCFAHSSCQLVIEHGLVSTAGRSSTPRPTTHLPETSWRSTLLLPGRVRRVLGFRQFCCLDTSCILGNPPCHRSSLVCSLAAFRCLGQIILHLPSVSEAFA